MELQGAMLDHHEEELVNGHFSMESLAIQVTELSDRFEEFNVTTQISCHQCQLPLIPLMNLESTILLLILVSLPTVAPFIFNCEVMFLLQPLTYAMERSKVAYMISLLSGQAHNWAAVKITTSSAAVNVFNVFSGIENREAACTEWKGLE